ncbi:hypothetical protein TUM17569_27390 [Klebsiella oxytoca]|nr:hypothetical protein TUM17568_26950 [Klebsiella oxytoca]GJK97278.1 hypothetical protein TUM17569_27390 [Klebsiella oxytoca]
MRLSPVQVPSTASGKFSCSALCSPGAAPDAPCPGYGFTAVCGPVARRGAQHRLREIQLLCALLPGGGA